MRQRKVEHSIVNLSQILASVGVALDAATDAQKTLAVLTHAPCESVVKRFLKFEPCLNEYDYYLPGPAVCRQDEYLMLRHPPLRKIREVWVNDEACFNIKRDESGGDQKLEYGVDYIPEWETGEENDEGHRVSHSATLKRLTGGIWPNVSGSVRVCYRAGYTVNEFLGYGDPETERAAVIHKATLVYCSMAYRNYENQAGSTGAIGVQLPSGSLTSEKLQDYSYSIDAASTVSYSGFRMEMPASVYNQLWSVMDKGAGAL